MKLLTILTCIVFINMPLFSQQKVFAYDGEYQIRPGFTVIISTEGSDHYILATGQAKEKLTRINDNLFKIESINETIDFSLKPEKNVVVVTMQGIIFHAPKLPLSPVKEVWKEIKLPAEAITGLDGEYQLNASAKFLVSIENGLLFVQLTGQSKFEVFPYAPDKFFYKVVEASIDFIKDNKRVVKYLLLHQNGMILQANKL